MSNYFNKYNRTRHDLFMYDEGKGGSGFTGYSNTLYGTSGPYTHTHGECGDYAWHNLGGTTGGTLDFVNILGRVHEEQGTNKLATFPVGVTGPWCGTNDQNYFRQGTTMNSVLLTCSPESTGRGNFITWPRNFTTSNSATLGTRRTVQTTATGGTYGKLASGWTTHATGVRFFSGSTYGVAGTGGNAGIFSAIQQKAQWLWPGYFIEMDFGKTAAGGASGEGFAPSRNATTTYDFLLTNAGINLDTLSRAGVENKSLNSIGCGINTPKCATGPNYPYFLVDKTAFVLTKFRTLHPIKITELTDGAAANWEGQAPRPVHGTTAYFAGFTTDTQSYVDRSNGIAWHGDTNILPDGLSAEGMKVQSNIGMGLSYGDEGCAVFLPFRDGNNNFDYALIGIVGTGTAGSQAAIEPANRINLLYDDLAYRIQFHLEYGIEGITGPTLEFVSVSGFTHKEEYKDFVLGSTYGLEAEFDPTGHNLISSSTGGGDILGLSGARNYNEVYYGLTSTNSSDYLTNKWLHKIKINEDEYLGMMVVDGVDGHGRPGVDGVGATTGTYTDNIGGTGGTSGFDNTERVTFHFNRPIEYFNAVCYTQSYDGDDFAVYEYHTGATLGQSGLLWETLRFAGTGPEGAFGCTYPACTGASGGTYADVYVSFTADAPGVTSVYLQKWKRTGSAWALKTLEHRPVQGTTLSGLTWGFLPADATADTQIYNQPWWLTSSREGADPPTE